MSLDLDDPSAREAALGPAGAAYRHKGVTVGTETEYSCISPKYAISPNTQSPLPRALFCLALLWTVSAA